MSASISVCDGNAARFEIRGYFDDDEPALLERVGKCARRWGVGVAGVSRAAVVDGVICE